MQEQNDAPTRISENVILIACPQWQFMKVTDKLCGDYLILHQECIRILRVTLTQAQLFIRRTNPEVLIPHMVVENSSLDKTAKSMSTLSNTRRLEPRQYRSRSSRYMQPEGCMTHCRRVADKHI